MTTLAEILLAPERRGRIAASIAGWIERHVQDGEGLKGFAMKAGLSALKTVRPDALSRGVDRLMPDFVAGLEPLWARSRQAGEADFGEYLAAHSKEGARAIMAALDARAAASASYGKLRPAYQRLRSTIEGELRATLPALAKGIGAIVRPAGKD